MASFLFCCFLPPPLSHLPAVSASPDVHFNRQNRNADWILPFPNAARTNPDEVLRPMTKRQVREMEEEVRRAADEINEEEEQQATEEEKPTATAVAGQQ